CLSVCHGPNRPPCARPRRRTGAFLARFPALRGGSRGARAPVGADRSRACCGLQRRHPRASGGRRDDDGSELAMTSARLWPIALTCAASASACIWHDYDAVTGPESAPDAPDDVSSDSATPPEASDPSDVADVAVGTEATTSSSSACSAP